MTTIREVANAAGVSIATVSRVLNDSGYVSVELRERVREVAQTLNYRPSRVAQNLRQNRTQIIGVLIPHLDQPFFSTLAFNIQQTLAGQGYHTMLFSTMEDPQQERDYVDTLIEHRVDGVIAVPVGTSPSHLTRFASQNVPIVLLDRDIDDLKSVDRIMTDNRQGAYDGMRHLIEYGHEKIVVIGGPTYSIPVQNRIEGIRQALSDSGRQLEDSMLVSAHLPQFEMGYSAALSLLVQPDAPTAIFALSDVTAIGVLHAAHQMNLRVPDDVSVVGFDNIPLAGYSIPGLTTVAQPIADMGRLAAQRMVKRLNGEIDVSQYIKLDTQLVLRGSTMPL